MAYAAPSPSEMFSDAPSPVAVAERFEEYKGALTAAHQKAAQGGQAFVPGQGIVKTGQAERIGERIDALQKSASPEVLQSLQGEIDALKGVVADIAKDWTLTNPLSTGLVPYDLEAPSKLLVPRLTPLRNIISRKKGQGTARQFKRILGWTNSGVGGVADASAFLDSNSVQTSFGSLALRRGAKIAYAADEKSVIYCEQGLSDQVNWQAQFAGQGFQDVRSLSQTALLWATFGAEERALLYGRGTKTGYAGAVSAPGSVTAVGAATGGSIGAATYYVVVTARTGFGESVVSSEVNTGALSGSTNKITVTVGTEPVGALGYNLYVGTVTGTCKFQTSFVGDSYELLAYNASGAAQPSADSSADANGYDGFLTVQSDPTQSGYVHRVNAALSTSNPGDEYQQALLSLYQSVKADPDEIWVDAAQKKALGDLLKNGTSNGAIQNNYRLSLNGDGNGHFLGSVVTGIQNQVTTKMVDFQVHPYMPAGVALIRSRTLPVPDSEVSETAAVVNVQDYMAIDWPVVQFTYDQSTYLYGALVHYAPAWSGLLIGVKPS